MPPPAADHHDVPFPSPAHTPTKDTTRYPNFRTTHNRQSSFAGGHVTRKASTSESDWSLPDQPQPQPRTVSRKTSNSTLTAGPVRVFPRPPADGNWTPTIRPGSVKSVSLERGGGDDDSASRRSVRSVMANGNVKSRPPLPSMASNDSLLPTMVQAIESSLGSKVITGSGASNGASASASASATAAPRTRTTSKASRDSRPDRSTRAGAAATAGETADRVPALLNGHSNGHDGGVGIIGSFDKRLNRSVMSFGAKAKAEKVVNADPQPRLASLYLVTGLFKVSSDCPQGPGLLAPRAPRARTDD